MRDGDGGRSGTVNECPSVNTVVINQINKKQLLLESKEKKGITVTVYQRIDVDYMFLKFWAIKREYL